MLANPCIFEFVLYGAKDGLRFDICPGLFVLEPLRLFGLMLRAAELFSRDDAFWEVEGPLMLPVGDCTIGGVTLERFDEFAKALPNI